MSLGMEVLVSVSVEIKITILGLVKGLYFYTIDFVCTETESTR